ncbi:MAG: hypothetical protein KF819_03505 [Labilithrix sp.]|nr:hypothetical protein [Labilithrix sp.]
MSASDPRAFARAAALSAFSILVVTCSRPAEPPTPPDVSSLLAAYAEPGGTLDPARPAAWLEAAQDQLDVLGGGEADMIVGDLVARTFERAERAVASLPSRESGLVPARASGVVELETACGDRPDETAEVAVAIVDGTVSPLLWGTAHACPLWRRKNARGVYSGRFTIYRYPSGDLLIGVDGTMAGLRIPVVLDFRLVDGHVEKRVATTTGDVIAARDGLDVLARAANGVFRCDANLRRCR